MAAEVESLASSVQELSMNRSGPPSRYILKDGIGLNVASSFPVLDIPVIDLGLLASSSPEGEEQLDRLRSALGYCGYFQTINHGIESSFLDQVHDLTREFFHLPMEEKKKYSREANDIDGYGNDVIYSEKQTLDWNDRLYLNTLPENIRKLKKWPKNPEKFSEMLCEYTTKLQGINEIILKAIAKSLNLEENCFVKQFGKKPTALARFNLYPPCPTPHLVLAAKAHGDASGTTYLLQDREVEGLQFLKDDKWYRAPIIPDAIVFNVGDQLEIMTNGIYKSPMHRVVTNKERERITAAFFFAPDPTSVVEPAEGLIDEKRPRLYKKVVDYTANCFELFQKGKRPIDALRI
ncbi:unnamed protein product [Ilex paraguariensis]|uniref:Fe2OG dioxygenase domain-containing protein n=1 Tax=Ilex paraguariensis TaxID=185542 RepID=A0ABC8U186_9AQUA